MTPVQILGGAAAATLLLYVVPGGRTLARPLVLLSTYVHELGHGIVAMLVGGSFKRLAVHADASGLAAYEGRFSPLARAAIAAGGPLAPPVLAAALFFASTRPLDAPLALGAFGGFLALAALIWVRNVFGWIFGLGLGAALGALAFGAPDLAPIACAFLGLELSLAAFARGDYLFKSQARTAQGTVPSDTAQIAAALWLPHWFWGALLAAISLGVLGAGLWAFGRP
jgi:hypothetical protein